MNDIYSMISTYISSPNFVLDRAKKMEESMTLFENHAELMLKFASLQVNTRDSLKLNLAPKTVLSETYKK